MQGCVTFFKFTRYVFRKVVKLSVYKQTDCSLLALHAKAHAAAWNKQKKSGMRLQPERESIPASPLPKICSILGDAEKKE